MYLYFIKQKTIRQIVNLHLTIILLSSFFFITSCTKGRANSQEQYRSSTILIGNIEETVSSTGNVKAVGTVSVLAQVTGNVDEVLVDFNQTVHRGQVLARINTEKMLITLKEAQASLERTQAQHEYNTYLYEQNIRLREQNLISESELSEKKLSYLSSRASLISAQASEESARLNIEKYATILSPIDGIVLNRAVESGQTVVGSGTSNSELFTLAENLQTMEIEAKVDELDIGRIKKGQKVSFTVEASPNIRFKGLVKQIRLIPTTASNVVSYTVIVEAKNDDKLLLPGMTANVNFIVTERTDVVILPNSALRYTPADTAAIKAENSSTPNGGLLGIGGMPGPGLMGGGSFSARNRNSARNSESLNSQSGKDGSGSPGKIWLLAEDGSISSVQVLVGASDNLNSEILAVDGENLLNISDVQGLLGKKVITRSLPRAVK